MKTNRMTSFNKNRDAWVEINLGNLENNILQIKKQIKANCKKMPKLAAVIKADGYGHGSLMTSPILDACGIDYFATASIDEGIELRENKIEKPILVLGASPIWAFENAIKYDIELSIFNEEHLEIARQLYSRLGKKLKAHIKIDTGMNRIGLKDNVKDYIKKAVEADYIDIKGIFTHFADVENEELFKKQITDFKDAIEPYKDKDILIHCLNSPGIYSYPEYSFDMVRIGIIMWGLNPYSNREIPEGMKTVMGLKARITNIHIAKKGDGVSYGHTYVAKKDTKIVTIPIGYADGVARKLSGKITAILNGKPIKQVGRITMDQMMFDATDVDCSVGDVVILLGEENKIDTIDTWASSLDTINYEITCRLKMRLARIYVR